MDPLMVETHPTSFFLGRGEEGATPEINFEGAYRVPTGLGYLGQVSQA